MALLSRKSISALQAEAAESGEGGLRRSLGGLHLILLGTGAIIGADIFMLTGTAAASSAGPGVVLSIALSAAACGFAALCYAEFASTIPVAGGAYTYAYATLGEFFAWLIGWDLLLAYVIGASAVAVRWSGTLVRLLAEFGIEVPPAWTGAPVAADLQNQLSGVPGAVLNLPAVGLVLLLTLILVIGIRGSATLNNAAVLFKVAILVVVIGFGFVLANADNWHPFVPPNTGHFGDFGWSGVLRGAGVIFFAYVGFDAVSTVAQEARHPEKDMPVGILGALALGTILCILVALVMTGMAHYTELDDPAPIVLAISRAGPELAWLRVAVAVASLGGLASVALVMLIGLSRVLFSMSRDGLLPTAVGRVHRRFGTPAATTAVTGLTAAAAAGLAPVGLLGQLTNIGILLAFILVCAGVWVFRVRSPEIPRAFATPLVPLVPLLGIVSCLALAATQPTGAWLRLLVWLLIGVAVYFLWGRRRSRRDARPAPSGGG